MIYCRGVARCFNAQCSNTSEENHFSEKKKKLLNLATKAKNFFFVCIESCQRSLKLEQFFKRSSRKIIMMTFRCCHVGVHIKPLQSLRFDFEIGKNIEARRSQKANDLEQK
jgi:hypothetical protein